VNRLSLLLPLLFLPAVVAALFLPHRSGGEQGKDTTMNGQGWCATGRLQGSPHNPHQAF
jgi:hypothetical protein